MLAELYHESWSQVYPPTMWSEERVHSYEDPTSFLLPLNPSVVVSKVWFNPRHWISRYLTLERVFPLLLINLLLKRIIMTKSDKKKSTICNICFRLEMTRLVTKKIFQIWNFVHNTFYYYIINVYFFFFLLAQLIYFLFIYLFHHFYPP